MAQPSVKIIDLLSAAECGATCAVAGLAQRDLLRCAAGYPDLFPGRPFDPAGGVFGLCGVALGLGRISGKGFCAAAGGWSGSACGA